MDKNVKHFFREFWCGSMVVEKFLINRDRDFNCGKLCYFCILDIACEVIIKENVFSYWFWTLLN